MGLKRNPKYLYIISDGTDLKIGVARDPDQRLKTLQTGNKNKLTLEYCEFKDHAHQIEKQIHRVFNANHIGGEWFTGLTVRDIRIQILLCTDYD